jgi:phenylacetate-coenzyme A ligase PaaK-like adenylate-forming protein
MGLSARWVINLSRQMIMDYRSRIFNIKNNAEFWVTAQEIFTCQFNNNPVYHEFITSLGVDQSKDLIPDRIPFLPVEFFRNHKIITGNQPVEKIFESSGTTGFEPARHFITDLSLYEESFFRAFRLFYGNPEEFLIAAILPSYTDREGSSLVYMADKLITFSHNESSGFYRDNIEELLRNITNAKREDKKILLIGVSFALLDLAEKYSPDLSGVIVMETGGMKGRRKELTRSELHAILKEKLNVAFVHSEYGMTELLSQAYSKGDGLFYCPPWMKILIRDPQDPLTIISEPGRTGGINIIDLANINSVSFIATGDLGKSHEDGSFEVLGRFDNSDIRGCNLLIE